MLHKRVVSFTKHLIVLTLELRNLTERVHIGVRDKVLWDLGIVVPCLLLRILSVEGEADGRDYIWGLIVAVVQSHHLGIVSIVH